MRSKWQVLIIALLFFITVDTGLFSSADGMVVALMMVLLYLPAAPYLFFMVISVQDGAGLSYFWSNATYVGLACIIIGRSFFDSGKTPRLGLDHKPFLMLAWFALAVIVWALAISLINHFAGGLVQNMDRRNPMLVALLMILNVVVALVLTTRLREYKNLSFAIWLCIFHGLMIIFAQALNGPQMFHSAVNVHVILDEPQLVDVSALGFPRLTGTYLSPNAFAQTILHFGLLLIALRPSLCKSKLTALAFFLLSLIIIFLNQTKGAAVLSFMGAVIILYLMRKDIGKLTKYFFVGALAAVSFWATTQVVLNFDEILLALRFVSLDENYRALAIGVALDHMTWSDWLFGMGLSHWLVFFDRYLYFTLADPHMWIVSIPGTFGLMGVVLYVLVFAWLIKMARKGNDAQRFLAIMLLLKLALHDLFEVPYLLGNASLSCLIWLTMGLLVSAKNPQPSTVIRV